MYIYIYKFLLILIFQNYKSEEYQKHKIIIWKAFVMKNMKGNHDSYLKRDVLLKVDMFEIFRKESKICFELDPAHYLSIPCYRWDAMLNVKGVKTNLRYRKV